ncbi:unnamed protein product [Polarella glacialis]|uniref:Uncharacterized protein n=1 Tax=Polarella glacialis TaxID=89957 RepID=A0A813HZ71_POLGL|nr:unnamed protein product [Polarella glacialis]CAE8642923.1 unnamed protein product [Polarella glacialis]
MGKVMFVSHQWVGNSSPDPNFDQLRVLQEALANLMSGSITISIDVISEVFHGFSQAVTAADFKGQQMYIWYDYFSCPQMAARTEDQDVGADLSNAVESIPGYVELSDFFVIVAPVLKHADRDEMLGFMSWKTRGWCRAERAARALAAGDHHGSMIVVQGPRHVQMSVPAETLQAPVGLGDFTVQADVERVTPFMRALLKNKLSFALAAGDIRTYRLLINVQSKFCQNLDIENIEILPGIPSMESSPSGMELAEPYHVVNSFMHQNGFLNVSDPDECGWAPLHYAALRDDPLLVRGLLARRADIEALAAKDEPLIHSLPNSPVLHIACVVGNNKALQELIAQRADVNKSSGIHSLHLCALAGNVEGIKLLLAHKADANHIDMLGNKPICPAAAFGQADSIRVLVAGGSQVATTPGAISPLLVGIWFLANVDTVKSLLEARADVDEREQLSMSNPLWAVFSMKALAYRFNTSAANYLGYHIWGATPLILSMVTSRFDLAEVLLEGGAKREFRNDRGKTAADIGREVKCPAALLEKLEPP